MPALRPFVLLFGTAHGITLRANNVTRTGLKAVVADVRVAYQEACEKACGEDVDVTCYTQCEVDLYKCYDNHVPPGGDVYEKCQEDVLTKYGSFVSFWHMAKLVGQHKRASSKVRDMCEGVCGASSNCITSCEAAMHRCTDDNTPNSEDKIEGCQKDVKEKHKTTVALWSSMKKTGHDECNDACGHDSNCVTACEVGMYTCVDDNTPVSEGEIEKCQKGVVEAVKATVSLWSAEVVRARFNSITDRDQVLSTKARHRVQGVCNDACGNDSACVTACEVEMYTCHDVNTPLSEDKIKPCEDAAVKAVTPTKGKAEASAKKFL